MTETDEITDRDRDRNLAFLQKLDAYNPRILPPRVPWRPALRLPWAHGFVTRNSNVKLGNSPARFIHWRNRLGYEIDDATGQVSVVYAAQDMTQSGWLSGARSWRPVRASGSLPDDFGKNAEGEVNAFQAREVRFTRDGVEKLIQDLRDQELGEKRAALVASVEKLESLAGFTKREALPPDWFDRNLRFSKMPDPHQSIIGDIMVVNNATGRKKPLYKIENMDDAHPFFSYIHDDDAGDARGNALKEFVMARNAYDRALRKHDNFSNAYIKRLYRVRDNLKKLEQISAKPELLLPAGSAESELAWFKKPSISVRERESKAAPQAQAA